MDLRLTEIFHSIQGEGSTVGLPTTFIRLTGCSLRCSWCDTTYSFEGGNNWTTTKVMEHLATIPTKRVCVTGGEPLDQREACLHLMDTLLQNGYQVVLETSGSHNLSDVHKLEPRKNLQISTDVKCPSSNMQKRNKLDELAQLQPHDQLKFVLSDERDYQYAKEILANHPTQAQILLQPMWASPNPVSPTKIQGQPATLKHVAEWVIQDGLDARVGTQLHKIIWAHEQAR